MGKETTSTLGKGIKNTAFGQFRHLTEFALLLHPGVKEENHFCFLPSLLNLASFGLPLQPSRGLVLRNSIWCDSEIFGVTGMPMTN